LLLGLPVELDGGSIGSITARIPWTNPLGGNLGLSFASLHLTLHLIPHATGATATTINLADSVADFAETFVHEELTPREEEDLNHSIHDELGATASQSPRNVPGGFDPFERPEAEERPSLSNKQAIDDPIGISLFATLFHRLLLRFEMDAADTRITIVHPGHAAYTMTLSDLRFNKQSGDVQNLSDGASDCSQEERRSIRMTGLAISCCNLDNCLFLLLWFTLSSLTTV
jgi:autophagy-related protein 2